MEVITLLNEKGGVGKTSLSRHIAAGLAIGGRKVLLIDADPQAHSTHQMRLAEYGGLYRLLVQEDEWKSVIKTAPAAAWAGTLASIGQLYVLPGNVETRAIPGLVSDVGLLRERLNELDGWIDTVVIDTAPTPSLLQSMVYIATDSLIYPTQAQSLSLDGLAKSVTRMHSLNKSRAAVGLNSAKLIGVVPTMVRNTTAHAYGLNQIEQHFGVKAVLPSLAMMTAWQDAEYAKETLYTYAPGHEATNQMIDVLKRVESAIA